MIYILILLSLLILSLFCLPSLHQSYSNLPDSETEIDLMITEEEIYDQRQCNYTLVSPKRIINPYKSDLINFVPQKPFGSFYLKCAACLAVANQISKSIENIIQSERSTMCLNPVDKNMSHKINELCTRGFKNYDLRKYKEVSMVTDKFKCTEHVKSNMDGGWTKKLREICNLYTSRMDLENLSNIYANNTQELSTHLCRGSGIFRDCQNLEVDQPSDVEEELCKKCDC